MIEDESEAGNLPPTETKAKIIDPDTKFSFSIKQLSFLGTFFIAICGAAVYLISTYFGIKTRLDNADKSLTEINKKLEEAAVSSEKYRKLDSELQTLKMETQHLKESNQELRNKVFK